jgi:RHS repeat-associated protein
VTQTDTYLLGATTARTETYSYDALLRLTGMSGTNFSTVGGAVGSRSYGYDGRGNRTSQTNEDCGYGLTYGTSAHPDQLTSRASSCTGSILATTYAYDRDGRVSSMTGPNDSSGSAAWQFTMTDGPDSTSGAFDSVYKSISVNGAVYSYFYDAFNRRRAKQYPLNMRDEFFYSADNLLLVDLGNDSTVSVAAHPEDDYVWLDGRPLAVVRGKLNSSYARQADTSGADCTRNGEYQQCGTFGLVTDQIGSPVLMLDDHRRVAGEGSMDPFGAVNTVSLNKESAHPYANNTSVTLADFKQPAWVSGTTTRLRVDFAVMDTETNSGTPLDSVALKDGDTGTTLSSGIGGHHAGRIVTAWVTPSAGRVQVAFTSSASNFCPATGGGLDCSATCTQAPNYPYTGVVVEGYEYQRYQTGATPSWTPLRYPGQYSDAESGLHQNWNRFLGSEVGRYLQVEPKLANPRYTARMSKEGYDLPVYAYAGDNPEVNSDPTGLYRVGPGPECQNWYAALREARNKAGCNDQNKCDPKNACAAKVDECSKGCDVCQIMGAGVGPSGTFENLGPLLAHTDDDGQDVQFSPGLCSDPGQIDKLADTMIHEAAHACFAWGGATHIYDYGPSDLPGLGDLLHRSPEGCTAPQIAAACMEGN